MFIASDLENITENGGICPGLSRLCRSLVEIAEKLASIRINRFQIRCGSSHGCQICAFTSNALDQSSMGLQSRRHKIVMTIMFFSVAPESA